MAGLSPAGLQAPSRHQGPGGELGKRSPAPEAADRRPGPRALAAPPLPASAPAPRQDGGPSAMPPQPSGRLSRSPWWPPMACQAPSLPWTQELAPSCPPGSVRVPAPLPMVGRGRGLLRGPAPGARAREPTVLPPEAVSSCPGFRGTWPAFWFPAPSRGEERDPVNFSSFLRKRGAGCLEEPGWARPGRRVPRGPVVAHRAPAPDHQTWGSGQCIFNARPGGSELHVRNGILGVTGGGRLGGEVRPLR